MLLYNHKELIDMKKMKMTIKDAVKYSQNHSNDVAIHVPTRELYDKVIKYLENLGYMWFNGGYLTKKDKFSSKTSPCVKIYDKPDYDRNVTIDSYVYHEHCSDEIIELIEEEPELTIVIKSDGKKVVTAECNGIKVESHCNTNLDKFSNKEGAYLVLGRLFKELNSKSIHKGDIVEVETVTNGAPKDTIGLQGIVTEIDGTYIGVKFPTKISGAYHWGYSEKELKLIRKA
jgi:hypothetical protein